MSYKQPTRKPQPTPTDYPEAIRDDVEFIDSLIDDTSGRPRNLAVQNIHEDRYHGWIAPGNYGLVTRSEYLSSFGWLKLVNVTSSDVTSSEATKEATKKTKVASKRPSKQSEGGAK